ncbi:ABC transporter permease [Rhodococcus sp. IC4_135]|nr:ABC transporter permease [Rhodococcus sp. IC4_135]
MKTIDTAERSSSEISAMLRTRLRTASVGNYTVLISAIALYVTLAIVSRPFLSTSNQLNLLDQWSGLAIIACGTTICILAGGFDLSVDAIFVLAGVVSAWVATRFDQPHIGLLAGLATGVLLGVFNGLLVTVGKINPFIATIASSVVFLGIAKLITSGTIITVDQPGFGWLGSGKIGPFTVTSLVFIAFALVSGVLLARTTIGRRVYAVGGNYEAARFSGISVGRVQVFAYAVSGFSAGLAGVLSASRSMSGQSDLRVALAFQVITAVVIGGVSVFGGQGTIVQALIGVLILALIGNGFNLINVDPAYQQLILGIIIVLAVAGDSFSRKSRS